jgi:5'-phosphate synthase pdxT subunit
LPEQNSLKETARPRIGVLAFQGDYDAHAGALREAGAEPVLVRKPDQLQGLDGLIIPGGESTTFLKFLERDGFLDALRAFTQATPTFGTCAGCILLSSKVLHPPQPSLGVLDATVERNAYGRQIDSSIREGSTSLGTDYDSGPLEMVYIRAPRIQQRQGHLLAATFHPELSSDRRIHRYFVDMVREASNAAHRKS